MIATYSEAHHRLNRLLAFFFVGCAGVTLIGLARHEWWIATVWAGAGLIAVIIEASKGQSDGAAYIAEISVANRRTLTDSELSANEFADERAFASKFLKFSNLLGATLLVAGFALGSPWWSNLLVAVVAWFTGMLGIVLLCAPGINAERDVVD